MNIESIFKLDDPPLIAYNRKKEDFIKISPTTGSAARLNQPGAISYEINNQESYLFLPDAFIYCEFEIKKPDDTDLGNDNITLEHNWFPRMFNQMILEVGSQQLEIIDHPGEIDTMLRFVSCSKAFKDTHGEIQGWIPDTNDGKLSDAVDLTEANLVTSNNGYSRRKQLYNNNKKRFGIKWHLHPLFGYLDFRKITYQLKFKLSLQKIMNNEDIFYGAATTKAKIIIHKQDLWIPQITPSLEIETMITKRLNTNKEIPVAFLKRLTSTVSIGTETTYDWHITNVNSNPRYLLVGFKTGAASFQTNNHKFIGYEGDNYIKSLRVDLNQTHYPLEKLQLDPINYNITETFHYYEQMCLNFGVDPQLNVLDYRNLYNIFCFDLSSQNEDLKKNGIQVKLHIEKSSFPITAYCVMLEDTKHVINVLNGVMTRIE